MRNSLLSLPAQAGTNGQQFRITTHAATRVSVTGINQNRQTVTWTASGDGSPVNRTFSTNNWWWQGNVRIVVIKKSGSQQCNINVPKVQRNNDWVSVNCGAFILPR